MPVFFKKNIGWATIVFLCLLPIARWFFILPLNIRFFDFSATMSSFGQITGLIGMTLFSLNLIISSRLKILDNLFYGLNNVYGYHRIIGTLAFSLLLFHPLFLALRYIETSLRSAALFLLPSADLAGISGRVALFMLVVLIVITFYLKIKYERWKISHKLMVIAFIFACLHALLISSDISRDLFLRFYILGLAALGLAFGFYHSFLSKFLNRELGYQVAKVNGLNQQSVEIELAPSGNRLNFAPGQFAFLRFFSSGVVPESHPFSMASEPAENNLKFIVKSLGDYTASLKNLKSGDSACVKGPFGRFSYKNFANKNQIWLAGGIGVTPFISMARELVDDDYKIDLYYCTKDKTEAVFIDELNRISTVRKNFKVFSWHSDDSGRITAKDINEKSSGLKDKDILLCGPPMFMESLKKQLLDANVPASRVHWEKFDLI